MVQLVISKPSDVVTGVRISASPHELGLFQKKKKKKKKKMPNKWRTIKSLYTKFDFTVDEGKERLNPSRDKN